MRVAVDRPHHPDQHEDVSHHDRREQLQEVLDPQVDNPEAPEVDDGEVCILAKNHPCSVEQGDRERTVEKQVGHVSWMLPR